MESSVRTSSWDKSLSGSSIVPGGGGSVICGTHYITQTRKLGSNSNTNQLPVVILSWNVKTCFIYKIFLIFIVVIMKYILIYMPSLRLNSFTWPNDEFAEKLARMGSSVFPPTKCLVYKTICDSTHSVDYVTTCCSIKLNFKELKDDCNIFAACLLFKCLKCFIGSDFQDYL